LENTEENREKIGKRRAGGGGRRRSGGGGGGLFGCNWKITTYPKTP